MTPPSMRKASEMSGAEVEERYKQKMNKFEKPCKMPAFTLCLSRLGTEGLTPEGKELAKLGGVLAAHTGKEWLLVVAHLFQRLGVSLVLGRIRQFPHAHVIKSIFNIL